MLAFFIIDGIFLLGEQIAGTAISAFLTYLLTRKQAVHDFSQDIVLITGAGSGLGREISLRLAKEGATIVGVDLNLAGLQETQRLVGAMANRMMHIFACDISSVQAVASLAQWCDNEVGPVDLLISNAGVVGRFDHQAEISLGSTQSIDRTMKVNVLAHFYLLKYFLPQMIRRRKGHIVSLSSAGGIAGCVNLLDCMPSIPFHSFLFHFIPSIVFRLFLFFTVTVVRSHVFRRLRL